MSVCLCRTLLKLTGELKEMGLLIELFGTLDLTGLFYHCSLTRLSVCVVCIHISCGKQKEKGVNGLLIESFGTLDLTRMFYHLSLTCLSVCLCRMHSYLT
jgi:hypothetical protein